jgi:hypothetical protein
MLSTYQTDMATMIDAKLTKLRESLPNATELQDQGDYEGGNDTVFAEGQGEEVLIQDATTGATPICIMYCQYRYDGRSSMNDTIVQNFSSVQSLWHSKKTSATNSEVCLLTQPLYDNQKVSWLTHLVR